MHSILGDREEEIFDVEIEYEALSQVRERVRLDQLPNNANRGPDCEPDKVG